MSLSWLKFSICSLLFAGLQTLIVMVSRVPFFSDFAIFEGVFNKALVVHVDLSVIFWFSSFGIFLNSLYLKTSIFIEKFLYKVAILAFILLVISPFLPGTAILSNYVPIIDNLTFFLAIGLYFSVVLTISIYNLFTQGFSKKDNKIFLLQSYNLIILLAALNFILTELYIEKNITNYYEIIFWGMGHILQYSFVILMILSWSILAKNPFSKTLNKANITYLIIASLSLLIYIYADSTLLYKRYFTLHMAFGTSILAIFYILIFSKSLFGKEKNIIFYALLASQIMFFYGAFISLFIQGSNTIIPAHYHGSTIAVTIAIIGVIYKYLGSLTNDNLSKKIFYYQIFLYFTGQVIHISALAISGGYGALRKSPQGVLNLPAQFWMGIMGFGGLLTIIAGFIFLIICYRMLKSIKIKHLNFSALAGEAR